MAELDPVAAAKEMMGCGAFTTKECKTIVDQSGRGNKIERFIAILYRKDQETFKAFKECLRKLEQIDLVTRLEHCGSITRSSGSVSSSVRSDPSNNL